MRGIAKDLSVSASHIFPINPVTPGLSYDSDGGVLEVVTFFLANPRHCRWGAVRRGISSRHGRRAREERISRTLHQDKWLSSSTRPSTVSLLHASGAKCIFYVSLSVAAIGSFAAIHSRSQKKMPATAKAHNNGKLRWYTEKRQGYSTSFDRVETVYSVGRVSQACSFRKFSHLDRSSPKPKAPHFASLLRRRRPLTRSSYLFFPAICSQFSYHSNPPRWMTGRVFPLKLNVFRWSGVAVMTFSARWREVISCYRMLYCYDVPRREVRGRGEGGKNALPYQGSDSLYRCTLLHDTGGSLNIFLPSAARAAFLVCCFSNICDSHSRSLLKIIVECNAQEGFVECSRLENSQRKSRKSHDILVCLRETWRFDISINVNWPTVFPNHSWMRSTS